MKVGFIGLGAMGRGMAGALLKAGHTVSGFDLNPAALAWLEDNGGARAAGPAQACDGADAAVLMVVNAQQAEAVLFGDDGAVEGLPGGALVLSSVTMPAEAAQSLGARISEAGLNYLDAPVSGGTVGADGGTLTFMAAGNDAAWNAAQPLLTAMGQNIYRFGDHPGPGSTMKMVHQLAAGCNLAVAAEVMSFGAHLGLDPAKVLEVLNVSAGGSWMIANRGPRMLTEGRDASSAVDIFVKDLGIVLDAARASRFPVPVSAAALQVFLGASGAGFGKHDDSQATRFYERLGAKKVRSDQ
ncbi:MAG TPA: NAD(P)-dependent oxidoreductase [Thermohalobaculum sp.]|nr:NAD(P)-dependent oxidoreductase [Thermohalobaculum sp.]